MADFDPYRKWLGIPPHEQPPNHYQLLGIGIFESDPDVIANAADRQMSHVRSFQAGKDAEISQRLLNELAAARLCLLDPERKKAYDQELRRSELSSTGPPPPRTAQIAATAGNGPSHGTSQPSATPLYQLAPTANVARRGRSARRRRKNGWQGPVLTVVLIVATVLLLLLIWAGPASGRAREASLRGGMRQNGRTTCRWNSPSWNNRFSGWSTSRGIARSSPA